MEKQNHHTVEQTLEKLNPLSSKKERTRFEHAQDDTWQMLQSSLDQQQAIPAWHRMFTIQKLAIGFAVLLLLVAGSSTYYFTHRAAPASQNAVTREIRYANPSLDRNAISKPEDLKQFLAVEAERLYGVTDISQPLTPEQMAKLTDRKDNSKVLYKKYTDTVYKDRLGNPISSTKASITQTLETWSSGTFYKRISTWDGKVTFIVIVTADSEFRYEVDSRTDKVSLTMTKYPKNKNMGLQQWLTSDMLTIRYMINSNEKVEKKELPTWSRISLIGKQTESSSTKLTFESNTGPLTLAQIDENHRKAEAFRQEHKAELEAGNADLEYQRMEIAGPKGFVHDKYYVELNADNSIYLTKTESFDQDGSPISLSELTARDAEISFKEAIFDYKQYIPQCSTEADIQIMTITEDMLNKRIIAPTQQFKVEKQ